MAKDWDEDDWSPEARERFEKSKDRRQGIGGASVSIHAHNKRRKARDIARAVFDSRRDGKYDVKSAVELLKAQKPKVKWEYQAVLKLYKSQTCQRELWRLETRADTNSLHEREELIRIITDSLHFDKTTVYEILPGWVDKETGQVHPAQYVMKSMEEWSPIAKFAFDGMDYKLPKGRDPIPVPKFLSKEGLIDKAMKELGMLKERNVLENPDGSPFIVQIVKFSNQPTEQDGEK